MKLRAIHLTNVRRFADATASLTGIGDGISVVSEPNEFGKSTFFDALHALFFQPHRGRPLPVRSLQPEPGGGAVRIGAEIETDGGRFRIDKRFLSGARARVTDLTSGRVIAQDDEAEAWIGALSGQGVAGPAGLLWVRQGLTRFDASERPDKDPTLPARRDLLSSVAGEIDLMTGGRRMDRVAERCRAALAVLATETGRPRAGGPWKEAQDAAEALAVDLADLEARASALSTALQARARAETRLAEVADPTAQEARANDVAVAQAALAAARTHAEAVAAAAQGLRIAELQRGEAAQSVTRLEALGARLQEAERDLKAAQAAATEADDALTRASAAEATAKAANDNADAALDALRKRLDRAHKAELGRGARQRLAELDARLRNAEAHRKAAEDAAATLAGIAVTPARLATLERAATDLAQRKALQAAQAVTVRADYDGAARVTLGAQVLEPGAPVPLAGRGVLDLPGIGRLTIDPGDTGDGDDDRLAQADAAVAKALAACGAETVAAARDALRQRQEHAERQTLDKAMLAGLAPEGLDALRAALAHARTTAEAADDGAEPVADLAPLMAAAQQAAEAARRAFDAAREDRGRAATTAASARTAQELAAARARDAAAAAGPVEARAMALDAARTALKETEAAEATARRTRDDLVAAAPDLATAEAAFRRAEGAATQAGKEASRLRDQLAELRGQIRTQADTGVEETLVETRGRLEAARARADRFAAEAAALTRLRVVLDAVRTDAQDAYFGPVQDELRPLLAILHGDATATGAAALAFDPDRMLPGALSRAGHAEGLDTLSGGTQEQIAILTRLAFARLFARAGRPVPVILDDALVHTDDDRIVRMFTALHRVAADQQILVFTCRQRAFADLGGDRPDLRIGPAEDGF